MAPAPVIDEVHLAGGERGCLLLHGFTGSPLEMVPLAEALAAGGYTVRVARIAGHGTTPEDLASTTWEDWVDSARGAFEALRSQCPRVAVVGLSMGGALALHLAATASPRAVVALATPVRIRPVLATLARAVSPYLPYVPVIARVGPRRTEVMAYRANYLRIPLAAAGDLARLIDRTMALLPQIRIPALVVQGRRDWIIPRESADAIWRTIACV